MPVKTLTITALNTTGTFGSGSPINWADKYNLVIPFSVSDFPYKLLKRTGGVFDKIDPSQIQLGNLVKYSFIPKNGNLKEITESTFAADGTVLSSIYGKEGDLTFGRIAARSVNIREDSLTLNKSHYDKVFMNKRDFINKSNVEGQLESAVITAMGQDEERIIDNTFWTAVADAAGTVNTALLGSSYTYSTSIPRLRTKATYTGQELYDELVLMSSRVKEFGYVYEPSYPFIFGGMNNYKLEYCVITNDNWLKLTALLVAQQVRNMDGQTNAYDLDIKYISTISKFIITDRISAIVRTDGKTSRFNYILFPKTDAGPIALPLVQKNQVVIRPANDSTADAFYIDYLGSIYGVKAVQPENMFASQTAVPA